MISTDLKVFALASGREYGERVAAALGVALGAHEERDFEDGEHKLRPLENVRGADVYVVQSLYGDPGQSVDEKLVRLLFFIGALKDASAGAITAVIPYLCYARKDRKTKPRDPITTRYVAALLESVGVGRVVTLDVHNLAAYQNAFRCQSEHLEAAGLFAEHAARAWAGEELIVVSPDVGGVKRAERFREILSRALGREIPGGFMEKHRSEGVVSGDGLVGEVENRSAIIVDDLISAGTTMGRAAKACRARGAAKVHAVATHGLFMAGADQVFADPAIDSLVVTDSVPPFRLTDPSAKRKLTVLETAPLCAEAIKRIHAGGSLVELMGD